RAHTGAPSCARTRAGSLVVPDRHSSFTRKGSQDGGMTMRVLHVQRAKGVSGSERHLLSLLPALGAVGVETRMCVLSTGEGQRFVTQLEAAGVDVTVRNAGGDLNVKLVPELVADI